VNDELKVVRFEEHNGRYASSEYRQNQTEWDFAILKEANTDFRNQKEQTRETNKTRKTDIS
jgi:hypothetical protein